MHKPAWWTTVPGRDREPGLPTAKAPPTSPWMTRRYNKLIAVVFVPFLLVLVFFRLQLSEQWRHASPAPVIVDGPRVDEPAVFTDTQPVVLPPLYGQYHEYEVQTSEQHADPAAKYFFFANHAHNCGWGNVMQELILHSHMAYRLGRSFVYYNYTWNRDGSLYSTYNDHLIPSTIPLTALLQGPTAGSGSSIEPYMPHAVTEDYFHKVCPPEQRRQIDSREVEGMLGQVSTAGSLIEKWVEVMGAVEEKCVEIPKDAYSVFDIFIMGDASRLLDVWPSLSHSPVLREFAWSPLIELAFEMNRELVSPTPVFTPYLFSQPFPPPNASPLSNPSAERYAQIPGLLALHVRRGDFAEHCTNLARWGSSWVGFNSFEALPDKFSFPPDLDDDQRIVYQRPYCYPDIGEIARTAEVLRASERIAGRGDIKDVYIMTNGPVEWVQELKDALKAQGGWRSVSSSRDLQINWEQTFVKQAVDMLIGQRAQVFVGNGFSSLSGLITMLRMANDVAPSQTRLFTP